MQPAIIMMVKSPRAGRVKTRLCPPLSPQESAELASCFLRDTLRQAARSAATLIIACEPPDGRRELQAHAPRGTLWLAQEGDDLGRRQENAIAHVAGQGFS